MKTLSQIWSIALLTLLFVPGAKASGTCGEPTKPEVKTAAPADPVTKPEATPVAPAEKVEEGEKLGPLSLGMTSKELIALMKEPAQKEKPTVWGADGAWHSTWSYPDQGLEVFMMSGSEKGDYTVERLMASAGCPFKTDKGIGLGSTRTEVEKAYPAETWDKDFTHEDQIVVGSYFGGLLFEFKEGKVAVIGFGAFAE